MKLQISHHSKQPNQEAGVQICQYLQYSPNTINYGSHSVKNKLNPQDVSAAMIGGKSKYRTPPFLITFEMFNMNVHNFLVDFGASSIFMPYAVAKRLHAIPEKTGTRIMKLDKRNVKLIGELKYVLILMAIKPQYSQVIDIVVVDIPEAYRMLLSRDYSTKLNGYF